MIETSTTAAYQRRSCGTRAEQAAACRGVIQRRRGNLQQEVESDSQRLIAIPSSHGGRVDLSGAGKLKPWFPDGTPRPRLLTVEKGKCRRSESRRKSTKKGVRILAPILRLGLLFSNLDLGKGINQRETGRDKECKDRRRSGSGDAARSRRQPAENQGEER